MKTWEKMSVLFVLDWRDPGGWARGRVSSSSFEFMRLSKIYGGFREDGDGNCLFLCVEISLLLLLRWGRRQTNRSHFLHLGTRRHWRFGSCPFDIFVPARQTPGEPFTCASLRFTVPLKVWLMSVWYICPRAADTRRIIHMRLAQACGTTDGLIHVRLICLSLWGRRQANRSHALRLGSRRRQSSTSRA